MAYIGTSPQNGVRNRFVYAATQGQTAFTGADADSKTLAISDQLYTDVYQNGVKLKLTTDWTATATTVTLVNAASADDVIEIVSFDVFSVSDTVPASTGGTFNGGIGATTGTFSGAVSGTTGTFSGNVAVTGVQTITANGAHINLDTPSSGQNAWITWKDNGASKWEVNKGTTHDFKIYSYALSANMLVLKGDGDIFFNSENASGNAGRVFLDRQDSNRTVLEVNQNTGGGTEFMAFRCEGTKIGSITQNGGSNTAFNTSSDYRLKENIALISDGITRVKKLKPSRFNWISDDTDKLQDGFIAHEVSPVIPEAVSGEKDAVFAEDTDIGNDKKGVIKPQALDYSKLTPLLTAALQEAIAKIEVLETKVAALEAE